MGESKLKRFIIISISLFILFSSLFAQTKKTSIYLYADFGSSEMAVASGFPGEPVPPVPAIYFIEGHEFSCWDITDKVTGKYVSGKLPEVFPEHDLFCTVVAKPLDLKISFNGFGMLTADNFAAYDYPVKWREPLGEEYDEWRLDSDERIPKLPFIESMSRKFPGWSLEPDGEIEFYEYYPIHVQKNTTLYAVWDDNPFLEIEYLEEAKKILSVTNNKPDSFTILYNRLSALCECVKHMKKGTKRTYCEKLILDSLKSLNKDQLRILRNSFFAKNGYVFKDQNLKDFFARGSYYTPDTSVSMNSIIRSEGDIILINIIQHLESGKDVTSIN